jgi:uncharacterized protein (UPF0332 family)
MNEEIYKMVEKAIDALEDAQVLFNLQRYNGAVNRSYYAVFGAASALLAAKNLYSKTHQGCRNLFYEHYVKTDLFELGIAQKLHENFEFRQIGDYDYEAAITNEDAKISLQNAKEFIEATKKYLQIT